MLRTVLSFVLAPLGALVLFLFGLALWSRRAEAKTDLRGVRTLCRFSGGIALMTDSERRAEQEEGGTALGEGVASALATLLESSGVVTTKPDADDFGWALRAKMGRSEGYVRVWHRPDEPKDAWMLMLVDPSSGGPGQAELLPYLDCALRGIPEICNVEWHPRESLLRDNWSLGSEHPLDPA